MCWVFQYNINCGYLVLALLAGVEPRTLYMLGEYSTTELYPQELCSFCGWLVSRCLRNPLSSCVHPLVTVATMKGAAEQETAASLSKLTSFLWVCAQCGVAGSWVESTFQFFEECAHCHICASGCELLLLIRQLCSFDGSHSVTPHWGPDLISSSYGCWGSQVPVCCVSSEKCSSRPSVH